MTSQQRPRLRVVNLNTWTGCLPRRLVKVVGIEPQGHKEMRFAALVEELRAREPDVVTLQECLPMPSYVQRLAATLGYDAIWRVCNAGLRIGNFGLPAGVGRGEGLAILAKRSLGLRHVGTQRLSGYGVVTNWCAFQAGPIRWAIAGKVEVAGRPVVVVNTHIRYSFPSRELFFEGWAELYRRGVARHGTPPRWLVRMAKDNDEVRDKELVGLARWINALRERHRAPVILGADFNLDPGVPQVRHFEEATGMTNVLPWAFPGILTWDPETNGNIAHSVVMHWPDGAEKSPVMQLMAWLDSIPQCPDHIFATGELEIESVSRAFDERAQGPLASDHYGVACDVLV
jgi:endonuclease/exonuclease/phosphatase family metal-dependent hydrolase